jgi:hypothetical protein
LPPPAIILLDLDFTCCCGAEAHHACFFTGSKLLCIQIQFFENSAIQAYGRGGGFGWIPRVRCSICSLSASGAGHAAINRHATPRPAAGRRRCPPMNSPRRVFGLLVRWLADKLCVRASVVATRWRCDRRTRLDLMGTRRTRRRTTGRGAASDGSFQSRVAVHSAAGYRLRSYRLVSLRAKCGRL